MTREFQTERLVYLLVFLPLLLGCGSSRLEQYNDFAIQCAESSMWKEASFRWNQVLDLDPGYAPAHNNLGVAYEALGRFDDAIVAYDEAIRLDPDNPAYRSNRARCLKQKATDSQQTVEIAEE